MIVHWRTVCYNTPQNEKGKSTQTASIIGAGPGSASFRLGGDVIHSGRNDALVSEGLPDYLVAVYRLCWTEGSFEVVTHGQSLWVTTQQARRA